MDHLVGISAPCGRSIARVPIAMVDDECVVLLTGRDCREDLFRYYFFEHGREVSINMGDRRVPGLLRTRMEGTKRVWTIALRPVVPSDAAPHRRGAVAANVPPALQHRNATKHGAR